MFKEIDLKPDMTLGKDTLLIKTKFKKIENNLENQEKGKQLKEQKKKGKNGKYGDKEK